MPSAASSGAALPCAVYIAHHQSVGNAKTCGVYIPHEDHPVFAKDMKPEVIQKTQNHTKGC